MSSATDEQRRLLDELRKLACDINEKEIRSHSVITLSQGRYNMQFRLDMNHDWLNAWHAELERIIQAIEATLGPCNCTNDCTNSERTGTCRNNAPTYLDFLCSECGFVHYHSDANDTKDGNGWGYCPNCGRRVVEVGE